MCKKSLLMMLLLALFAPWAANAQKALPYSYGFENNDLDAEGWTVQKTSSSTGISTSAKHEGSYGFQFVYSERNAYLVSPVLSGTESGVALSFYYKEYSSSYGDEQFYVGYTTDETVTDPSAFTYGDITTASLAWQLYETMLPAGTKKVAIKYVYNDAFYLYLDDFTFEAPSACPKPTDLNFALTQGDGTVATLSWTSDADAWQICLNGDETNLIPATTNPYTLTGLTPETTYTAKVRANCGSEQSGWSNEVTFTPTDAYQLTVNDGTSTNNYVPYYAYYHDSQQRSEFIIPASSLSDLAWGTITSMKFYPNFTFTTNASIKVYLMEVEEETFSDVTFYGETDATVVYDGTLSISPNGMTIAFAGNGFHYGGGNLLVGFYQSAGGSGYSSSSCPFYGVSATGGSISQYSSNAATMRNFLPKTTFDYFPGEAPACMWPTHLAAGTPGPRSVELSWTENGEATTWNIGYQIVGEEEQYVEVTENPYTLTGLRPETDYQVRVQSKCSDTEYSVFTSFVDFTTDVACPAPTDMVISDITAYTANVAWTSNNTNIEMRYSVDVRPITTFDDSQMHGWTNIDADGDGYVWVLASEAAGVYHSAGVDVTGQGHNGSHDFILSGSWTNAASTALTPDNYLVSPQITLGGSISFWAQAQDATYAAEHFGVAVSTTGNTDAADFTTIQEWTMTAKSANPFRTNAPRGGNNLRAGNWYQYTVDLSAYSGQGYVAIRHFDCTDQFILNVDDIFIEEPGFELPWVYVTNPASPQALTNLEPETDYIVQVRANCGAEDGYSQWLEGSFTTLPACMVPTNLVISNIDKRSADLTWTPNGEETSWLICVNGDENNLIDVTETTYSFTGLEPETLYSVKVRAYCDEELQSAWSTSTTFTTLVACPAPTNLAISDITNVSAVASWTGEGDFELQYAEDVWKHYDNGTFATSMGAGGTIYWGMMLPAESLTAGEPLTKVALHTSYAGEATLNVYLGGDQPTGTPAATQTFTMAGDGDFMEITLDTPVAIDGTQNLWITFYQSGSTYPADGCTGPTDPNGRWVSLDGETWADIAGYGYDYTWMIRAAFGNASTEWVTVDNATSPQAITGLTPETNYFVRVKHICGGIDGESVWVNTSFTTDIACPAPEALAATPYALSAVLSWEGISESYTARYGITEVGETLSSFDFEDETIPADFTNSTTYPWTVTEGGADESGYCVIPGNAGVNSSTSDLTLQVTGPCAVSFMAKVSSENNYDWGRFLIDGTQQMQISGTQDWTAYNYTVTEGTHTLVWRYYKDSSTSSNDDLFYVDNIVINEIGYDWNTTTATTNECVITGLEPATTYYVQVMGDCGDFGTSEWSEMISFTTTEDTCPMPTNLTVDAETLTATTADLSWNGSPDVESFTVRYRTPEYVVGGLSETFDNNSIPAGWMRYSGLVDDVVAGTATLSSTSSGWVFNNANVFGQYHAKINIWGSSAKYWLVTPEVTPTSGTFSFDLALTDYSNADPIEDPTAQADDRFVVLVYANDAWTILREWNNSGSAYVYNTIATEGEAVSIDLSAYVGQAVQIAFYGESTASGGDNDLHIDNVVIGNPQVIPATEWQTVTTSDMNVTLTGLTPETPYEAQVKADCSDPEAWSNTVNFTTLEQTTVTQTVALSAGKNWFSTNVEITLNDLKAALVAAVPGTAIQINSQTGNTKYNPNNGRWSGNIAWDVANMYIIKVDAACEITLEGMAVDPAEHPVTIKSGKNWIGFPLQASMSPTNAFAGFAINGDRIKSQNANSQYNRGRWQGGVNTLEPGKGYIFTSERPENRTLVFPAN